MAVKITYFVHGTTTDNETHRSTGWNPGELSELGIKQSKELKDQTASGYVRAILDGLGSINMHQINIASVVCDGNLAQRKSFSYN